MEVESSLSGALQQEFGHHPTREIRDDVVAFPVPGAFGQRIAPHAEAIGHVAKVLLAKCQRAGAIRVIGLPRKRMEVSALVMETIIIGSKAPSKP
jgi:hypothetical protein